MKIKYSIHGESEERFMDPNTLSQHVNLHIIGLGHSELTLREYGKLFKSILKDLDRLRFKR